MEILIQFKRSFETNVWLNKGVLSTGKCIMTEQNGTRDRLLDAAQTLFVQHDIDATSLRAITTEADANLASVNYHFGSKDELVYAVFARYLQPLNKARIGLLDELEQKANDQPLHLETILEAFLKPTFEMMMNEKSREFVCLLGRLFTEKDSHKMAIMHQFQEVQQRYFAALQRTLPDLPLADLTWRVHFMIGAMAHTFAVPEKISIPGAESFVDDDQHIMHRLITFAGAGLRAPVSGEDKWSEDTYPPAPTQMGRVEKQNKNGVLCIFGFDPLADLTSHERALIQELESTFLQFGLSPPPLDSVIGQNSTKRDLCRLLTDNGRLVRLKTYDRSSSFVVHADILENVFQKLENKYPYPNKFAVSDVRDLLGSTRKYVIPLMEHFDATGITTRIKDLRQLRGS